VKVKVNEKLDDLHFLINQIKKVSKNIGAIAIFIGTVRETSKNAKVLKLEYEAHETLANETLKEIIRDVKEKYGVIDAIVEHRLGSVSVGENIMYVIVASKHREEAFKALIELVDRIKHEVPIWKKEVTEKGAYWVKGEKGKKS